MLAKPCESCKGLGNVEPHVVPLSAGPLGRTPVSEAHLALFAPSLALSECKEAHEVCVCLTDCA